VILPVGKREVYPIIEEYAPKAEFPKQILKGLADIGGFTFLFRGIWRWIRPNLLRINYAKLSVVIREYVLLRFNRL
jgi:hypothetical protein